MIIIYVKKCTRELCKRWSKGIVFALLGVFCLMGRGESIEASEAAAKNQKLGLSEMPLNVYRGEAPKESEKEPAMFSRYALRAAGAENVDYVVGRRIDYGNWFTNVFYMNGNLAYCLNPELPAPETGGYQTEQLSNNKGLIKGLYYLFGGPGWDIYVNRFGYLEDGSFDKEYCSSHVILSYLSNPSGDAFLGLDNAWIEILKRQAENVESLPAPPDAKIEFEKEQLSSRYDPKTGEHITEEQKLLADSRNTVTLELPDGIYLVHSENGKKETGTVLLKGGERFYLGGNVQDANGMKWESGELSGNITNEWQALVIRSGGTAQDIGSWAWQQETPPGDGFRLNFDSVGRIRIKKESSNPDDTSGNQYYTLAGATFTVLNEQGKEAARLSTDGNGEAHSDWLPWGRYTIVETRSPKGYLPAKDCRILLEANEVRQVVKDQPQYGQILLRKLDAENAKYTSQGGAALAGAEYELLNDQRKRIELLKIDEKGEAYSSKLPLGKYVIRERKAPEGYLLDRTEYVVEFTSQDQQTELFHHTIVSKEQVVRGDLELTKVEDGTMKHLVGIPFKITSKTTGESHIIITDQNGYASTSSSWNLHTYDTNLGTSDAAGVWFGDGEVNDSLGALPYDRYEIEELTSEANQKYVLIPPFEVTISRNAHTVNLGTLTNDIPIVPEIEIGTQARNRDQKGKEIALLKRAGIIDSVFYRNLSVGQEYLLTGTLMDKETGEPILIEGKSVYAEKKFTPSKADGQIEVEFEFDSLKLSGKEIVVFETLYEEGVEIASHEDINAVEQTVKVEEKKEPREINTKAAVKTGDSSIYQILIWASIAVCSLIFILVRILIIRRSS